MILFNYFLLFVYLFFCTHILNYMTIKDKNKLVILRGLPGSGKTSFIKDYVETNLLASEKYMIFNFHDFYDKEENNPRNIPMAHSKLFNSFMRNIISSFNSGERRVIFIDNPNIQEWEYENYELVAEYLDFEVQIIEIECPDERYIEFFGSRSSLKMNTSAIHSMYKRWEDNDLADKVSPYIDIDISQMGDCLPYPKKTSEELDEELEKYWSNKVNED